MTDAASDPHDLGPSRARKLTPIEGFLVSIFRKNKSMEWIHQGSPIFAYKADLEAPLDHIDLRDWPDLFEALPNRTYKATAAARKLYLSLPRPF